MAERKASDVFVDCLQAEGVRYVFGIPGEETLDLNQSLADSSIEFVPVRHEQGGAYMADVATLLRDEEQFTMLVDTAVVDHLLDGSRVGVDGVAPERFEVVVNFLSHARNRRIRVIAEVPAGDPTVPSLTPIYPGANFPERESYDLFGITFEGHPDLTRILMPDDWHGHPLRKDDPAARAPVTFKGDPSPR